MKGDWQEVIDDCRSTVSKPPLGREPSTDFKRRILIAEHSPIRDISFRWKWTDIKSWIATHWTRHHWECRVSTQRTDRTGVDRNKLPQDSPVDFVGEANVQHLIDTMRKRLCFQASPETREYAEDLKQAITEVQPEIGFVLVPNCVYRCGCCELRSCGLYECLCKDFPEVRSINIAERYAAYNRYFSGLKREETASNV
jgi:hypothetical protein